MFFGVLALLLAVPVPAAVAIAALSALPAVAVPTLAPTVAALGGHDPAPPAGPARLDGSPLASRAASVRAHLAPVALGCGLGLGRRRLDRDLSAFLARGRREPRRGGRRRHLGGRGRRAPRPTSARPAPPRAAPREPPPEPERSPWASRMGLGSSASGSSSARTSCATGASATGASAAGSPAATSAVAPAAPSTGSTCSAATGSGGGEPRPRLGLLRLLLGRHLVHLAAVLALGELELLGEVRVAVDVAHVEERGLLQADVHEGGLHAGQDPDHAALVDVADDPLLALPLEVVLVDRSGLDQRHARLRAGSVDHQDAVARHVGPLSPRPGTGRGRPKRTGH